MRRICRFVVPGLLAAVAVSRQALASESGLTALVFALSDLQRTLHSDLAAAVRSLNDGGGGLVPTLVLLAVSFGYGVFHAVGPGHGKAVIATYAAASGDALRRSLWMAMLAAMVQGTSAVVLVGGAFLLLQNGARWAAREAEALMEPVSAAAIAGVGLLLLWRCWRNRPGQPVVACGHHHHHHHHHQGHPQDCGHDHPSHDHHHDHEHDPVADHAACGHSHLPAPDLTSSPLQAAVTAVAVGLRPCTGAILVLVLAFGLKLWGAGIAAAYAMALGTGITVALLAALARGSRHLADRLAAAGAGSAARWGWGFALAGGLLLLVMGLSLLADMLTRPAHPLL
ncbi:nickel/cobalt transporter [Novispirillum itersonii]|uniref:nickel/cobalt transporter n=1 Tax=Novispirillum itersonii TaxID=189 RepID=UPI000382212D|nr:hypothetical protein [Novispirillum itersonii]